MKSSRFTDKNIVVKHLLAMVFLCGPFLASCGGGRALRDTAALLPTDAATVRLKERMDRIGVALAGEGFESLEIEQIADIGPDAPVDISLPFRSRRRVVVVVIGQENATPFDVNLAVTSRRGRQVAEDRSPNHRGAVVFHARPEERYTATLSARTGIGRCMIAVFESGAHPASANLAGLFDADPVYRRNFGEATRHASRMGFRGLDLPERLPVRHGELVTISRPQKSGRCYMLAATGTAGVDTIEIKLFVNRQMAVADLQGRPEAWVRNCAEEDQVATAQIRALAGDGVMTLGWFDAARSDVYEIVGPPIRAEHEPPGIDALTARRSRELTDHGYEDIRLLLETHMAAGDQSVVPFWLGAGECATVRGLADSGLRDLDLQVRVQGEVLTADRGPRSRPEVSLCARADTAYEIVLIAMSGEGAVRLLSGELPDVPFPGDVSHELLFPAREAAALLVRASLVPGDQMIRMEKGEKASYRTDVPLKANRCYGVMILSSDRLVGATVLDPEGEERATWEGAAPVGVMTLCTETEGGFRVEARVEKEEPAKPPELLLFMSESL